MNVDIVLSEMFSEFPIGAGNQRKMLSLFCLAIKMHSLFYLAMGTCGLKAFVFVM